MSGGSAQVLLRVLVSPHAWRGVGCEERWLAEVRCLARRACDLPGRSYLSSLLLPNVLRIRALGGRSRGQLGKGAGRTFLFGESEDNASKLHRLDDEREWDMRNVST